MPIFELMMLICFGVSWPAALYKTYKSRSTAGKSAIFSVLIETGYIFGIINKLMTTRDFVTYFYMLNAVMVFADLVLWYRNRLYEKKQAQEEARQAEAAHGGQTENTKP
ncbi:MAG: hypothetical protein VB049_01780 [Candidatus Pelethousia sp.]|nr:hypothetical protein [Candidatus Pelethousia sp.]